MRAAAVSLFIALAMLCAKASGSSPAQNPDVVFYVEALEYELDALKSWGTDRSGKEEEWRNDRFRFRVIEPKQYAGAEWQILLPSAFAEDNLARLPRPGQKLRIRIDSLSLEKILAPKSEAMGPYRWPLLQFDYVFQAGEESEANKPVETTSLARPEIRESCPFTAALRSVSHG